MGNCFSSPPTFWIAGADQPLTAQIQLYIGAHTEHILVPPFHHAGPMGLMVEHVENWPPTKVDFDLKQCCGSLQIYPLWSHQLPAAGLIYLWSLAAEGSAHCEGNLMTNPAYYLRYLVGETVEEIAGQDGKLGVKLKGAVKRTMPVLVFVTKIVDGKEAAKPHAAHLAECDEQCRRVNRDILGPLLAPSGRAYRAVPLLLKWDSSEHHDHVRSTVRDGINWMLKRELRLGGLDASFELTGII